MLKLACASFRASGLTMQRRKFIALIGGSAACLAVAVLLLIGVGGYAWVRHIRVTKTELKREEDRRAAEAEAKRKLEEAGQQRLATEQERQARAAAEAEFRVPMSAFG